LLVASSAGGSIRCLGSPPPDQVRGRARSRASGLRPRSSAAISRMKGHEDGGNVLWKRRKHSGARLRRFPPRSLERR